MNSRAFKLGNNACLHQSSGETEYGRVVGQWHTYSNLVMKKYSGRKVDQGFCERGGARDVAKLQFIS